VQKLVTDDSSKPITSSAIGIGLLSLATMLGIRLQRRFQPANVLASSGGLGPLMPMNTASALGDNVMEMKTQDPNINCSAAVLETRRTHKVNSSRVGWGQLSSQSSRPLTLCYGNNKQDSTSDKANSIAIKPALDFSRWAENVESAQTNADNRKFSCNVKELATLYEDYKQADKDLQVLQKTRNENAKLMKGKLEPDRRAELISEGKKIKEDVAVQETKVNEMYSNLLALGLSIPNDTHPDTPIGEEENATTLRTQGTPRTSESAGFELKDHLQVGEQLSLFDFESGSKVSGQKFVYLKNGVALLELALVQWSLHEAVKKGWMPIIPPDLVREPVVAGCGFNPRDDENSQIYSVEGTDLCLAGTAEIPLAGIFLNELLSQRSSFRFVWRVLVMHFALKRVRAVLRIEAFIVCINSARSNSLHSLREAWKSPKR
jgi:hypothetical protein